MGNGTGKASYFPHYTFTNKFTDALTMIFLILKTDTFTDAFADAFTRAVEVGVRLVSSC